MNSLKEAKRLHDVGLAIHWLYPRAKNPVGSWDSVTRASWIDLTRLYKPEYNIGVKLGSPSRVGDGYLACIDCDVKSTNPLHTLEMESRLRELYPALPAHAPRVESGRGNGSCHIYGFTPEPVKGGTLAQSSETVRVSMPSVQPSKKERAELSESDIKAGIRLRHAWEISLMSAGRQMVLPPSIHPDSGKPYTWVHPFKGVSTLPSLEISAAQVAGGAKKSVMVDGLGSTVNQHDAFTFDVISIDFLDPRISEETAHLLTEGDVEDQSVGVFTVCRDLVRAGLSRDEILTLLTDPTNGLGTCAYRHVQKPADLKFRQRAGLWVWKYGLKKIMESESVASQFDVIEDEKLDRPILDDLPRLTEEEIEAQKQELLSTDWRSQIERGGQDGKGKPKVSLRNVMLVLLNAVGKKVFVKNMFTGLDLYGMDTPWGGKKGDELHDPDLMAVKLWLTNSYRFEPGIALINEALTLISNSNKFHPVRDYINTLKWDGVPRIDGWLKTYLGAKAAEPYLSAISRKTLVAMVARVFEPGKKFDTVLILEGIQGVGKSTVIRKLASDAWFSDGHIEIRDKDAVLSLRGVWAVELGELSALGKADVNQLKEFMSRTTDRIRVPYGHRTEAFPRQSVFIGTTNSAEYFKDMTGNRRFWPVEVGKCDFEAVERDRDQLFAEAKFNYDLGETPYLDDMEAVAGATAEQEMRTVHDAYAEKLQLFFDELSAQEPRERAFNPEYFSMLDLFEEHGILHGVKMTQAEQNRVGVALRKLGFVCRVRRENGKNSRKWLPLRPQGCSSAEGVAEIPQ